MACPYHRIVPLQVSRKPLWGFIPPLVIATLQNDYTKVRIFITDKLVNQYVLCPGWPMPVVYCSCDGDVLGLERRI